MSGTAPWLSEENRALATLLIACHERCFSRPLLVAPDPARKEADPAERLYAAAHPVLAHDGAADPCLIYANAAALTLWGHTWASMVGMPSRLTAEPSQQPDRAEALKQAQAREALEGYSGIRINRHGRRFRIEGARLWTLRVPDGPPCGQAAAFEHWSWLE
ncbi:MEKHLA domain-containing protein [Synechococcus sp. RSCCF101]|uniref:MEKHLA domain-containing protein n=1 Tax=Synechococcus sp. RSCCF101 TaxID=2511069 RepID=UPI001246765A|nr:MEKHLA domain-containing protein [Synechococcus sp. RSCCF101]QEY32762.1 MEKHLA domain-containing protein [Synechococcus sp. RSCCF101]